MLSVLIIYNMHEGSSDLHKQCLHYGRHSASILADWLTASARFCQESAKKRLPEGIKCTVQNLIHQLVSGVRRRGRKRRKKRANTKDVFA